MISVPWDGGVGRGPTRILAALGQPAHVVARAGPVSSELDAMVELNVQLAGAVRAHQSAPLILAGSCNLALGALAGLRGKSLAIVWLDAHGDFNSPATSPTGRLDGMALAVATGTCLPELREHIGLERPVEGAKTLLVEPRDLDPGEEDRLLSAGVRLLCLAELPVALKDLSASVGWFPWTAADALVGLFRSTEKPDQGVRRGRGRPPHSDQVYLHIDLDVLNPDISPGVNCTTPGGIDPEQLYEAVRFIGSSLPVAAGMIANYNPDRDPGGRTLQIAERLASVLIQDCGLS